MLDQTKEKATKEKATKSCFVSQTATSKGTNPIGNGPKVTKEFRQLHRERKIATRALSHT
jgi:hypothetical protein